MPNKTKMEERLIPFSFVTYLGTWYVIFVLKSWDILIHNDVEQDVDNSCSFHLYYL